MNTRCKMQISIFLLLCLMSMLRAQPQEMPVRQLSLEDAVKLAMKHNTDLESARLEVQQSDARVLEAWGYAMPSVDLTSN